MPHLFVSSHIHSVSELNDVTYLSLAAAWRRQHFQGRPAGRPAEESEVERGAFWDLNTTEHNEINTFWNRRDPLSTLVFVSSRYDLAFSFSSFGFSSIFRRPAAPADLARRGASLTTARDFPSWP